MVLKNVKGYDGYLISDTGNVYLNNVIIEPFFNKKRNHYYVVLKNSNNISTPLNVAKLVYETFVQKVKGTQRIIYRDGNVTNLNLENITTEYRFKKPPERIELKLDTKKQWKPLIDYEDMYKISDHGDIYSISNNKIITQNIATNGYFFVNLFKNNKSKVHRVHRLIYRTFVNKDIPDDYVIDHINRNKKDNKLSNLRSITKSENAKNKDPYVRKNHDPVDQYDKSGEKLLFKWNNINEILYNYPNFKRDMITQCCVGSIPRAYNFVWKYFNYVYSQDDYVPIKTNDGRTYSLYKINKEGQIINKYGRPLKYRINEYVHVNLTPDNEKNTSYSFLVHRLVALTFLPNPNNKPVVNHKDRDKKNHHVDNLEWTDQIGNMIHALGKKVQQIDPKTDKVISIFESMKEAHKSLGRTKGKPSSIGQVCKGKHETAFGYKWKYIE